MHKKRKMLVKIMNDKISFLSIRSSQPRCSAKCSVLPRRRSDSIYCV